MMASIPRPANILEGMAACWRCGIEYRSGGKWAAGAPCAACRYQLEQDGEDVTRWLSPAVRGESKPARSPSGTDASKRWQRMTPEQREKRNARRRALHKARQPA